MKVENSDVPTIFNPRKPRLSQSNAVLTSDHRPYGPFSHVLSRSESLCQPEDVEQVEQCQRRQLGVFKRLKNKCCSKHARKVYYGLCVTFFVTASWVGATHAIKYLYMYHPTKYPVLTGSGFNFSSIHQQTMTYNAPFFTTWFCTNWTVLFFPLYFFCQLGSPNYQTPTDILGESVRNFRDRGFTAAHFLTRCCMFCMLWVFTNYLYIHALSILVATDALALFAINVCCVYLLSWVILHDQFVGVRVSVSARSPAAVPPPTHPQNQTPVGPSGSRDMALAVGGWAAAARGRVWKQRCDGSREDHARYDDYTVVVAHKAIVAVYLRGVQGIEGWQGRP
ncbi:hypothetical protein AGLY_001506 [Aphis glycines]|uniref:Uncharacterized protein n=1 Tax=Aphis glycines TaxID=307491 RepID=A0A6G0U5U9_APHGL|nr:hypothetical protein AGLY_001506 [Aphis glycines]